MDNFMHKSVNLTKQVSLFNAGLEKSHVKPIYQMTYEQARLFLEKLQADSHQNIDADIEDKAVYTENSGTVDLRIVRPKNLQDNILPVILYIHGGGWVMGGKNTHDMLIRKLALATSSVVVFPEYSLSPEAKFPIALYQCYDVLKYLYSFPDEFNIDNKKIVIAGDSAGGNMTASIALMSKYSSTPQKNATTKLTCTPFSPGLPN